MNDRTGGYPASQIANSPADAASWPHLAWFFCKEVPEEEKEEQQQRRQEHSCERLKTRRIGTGELQLFRARIFPLTNEIDDMDPIFILNYSREKETHPTTQNNCRHTMSKTVAYSTHLILPQDFASPLHKQQTSYYYINPLLWLNYNYVLLYNTTGISTYKCTPLAWLNK